MHVLAKRMLARKVDRKSCRTCSFDSRRHVMHACMQDHHVPCINTMSFDIEVYTLYIHIQSYIQVYMYIVTCRYMFTRLTS